MSKTEQKIDFDNIVKELKQFSILSTTKSSQDSCKNLLKKIPITVMILYLYIFS